MSRRSGGEYPQHAQKKSKLKRLRVFRVLAKIRGMVVIGLSSHRTNAEHNRRDEIAEF
jgi:hypothetical protein